MEEAVVVFLVALFCQCLAQSVNVTCQSGKYPPDPKTKVVDTFTINLDLPPEERWKELATAKKSEIHALINGFREFIDDWGKMGQYLIDFIDSEGGSLDGTLPYPFAGEITGISNATGINLGEMVLYNLFYEFSALCTSIVAQDTKGKLYHARNLDFGAFMGWDTKTEEWVVAENLRKLIVNLEWQKNGKTIFKSVNFAGYTGILTGIKQNVFTFSMNERGGGAFDGFIKWLEGDRNETWMGFLTRNVMENATSLDEAMKWLQTVKMIAGGYFILGGTKPGEGYVITREPAGALDTWTMYEAQKWYILETNYDHWTSPPFTDDRRGPARLCMDTKMGPDNVGFAGIFNVLSTQPVLNKATTYTALMQVDTGTLETYIQDCKDPCVPT